MRIVGQYKDSDIRLTDLHMSETYGTWLAGPGKSIFEEVNWEKINVGIPKRIENMWGKDRALHVMDIDYKKRLPSVEVIVCLECAAGTKEGDYSELVLAWFQESDEDPFAKLITNLKGIDWKEKAHGWWISNL
jgi:hypothetical protein